MFCWRCITRRVIDFFKQAIVKKIRRLGSKVVVLAGTVETTTLELPKDLPSISEALQALGFNVQMLGSEKYVLKKLQGLSSKFLIALREGLVKHVHPRAMK